MKSICCTLLLFTSSWHAVAQAFLAELNSPSEASGAPSGPTAFAYFQLSGNTLFIDVEFALGLSPGRLGIFGPATPYGRGDLMYDLGDHYITAEPWCSDCMSFGCIGGSVMFAELNLTEQQAWNLVAGRLYLSVQLLPTGQVRGQIVPQQALGFNVDLQDTNAVSPNQPAFTVGLSLTGDGLTYSLDIRTSDYFDIQLHTSDKDGNYGASVFDFCERSCHSGCAGQGSVVVPTYLIPSLRAGSWFVSIKLTDDSNHEYRSRILPVLVDSDEDGVPDYLDFCPNTPSGAVVDHHGCSIQQLCPCDAPWKNHGDYIKNVEAIATHFRQERLITDRQFRITLRDAAQSHCGHRSMPHHSQKPERDVLEHHR